jgi:hypothetical protein
MDEIAVGGWQKKAAIGSDPYLFRSFESQPDRTGVGSGAHYKIVLHPALTAVVRKADSRIYIAEVHPTISRDSRVPAARISAKQVIDASRQWFAGNRFSLRVRLDKVHSYQRTAGTESGTGRMKKNCESLAFCQKSGRSFGLADVWLKGNREDGIPLLFRGRRGAQHDHGYGHK